MSAAPRGAADHDTTPARPSILCLTLALPCLQAKYKIFAANLQEIYAANLNDTLPYW